MPVENDVIAARLAQALGNIADERYSTLVGHVLATIPFSVWADETRPFYLHMRDDAPPHPKTYIAIMPFTLVDLDSDQERQSWGIYLFKQTLGALSDRDIEYMVARTLGAIASRNPWNDPAYAPPQGQDAGTIKRVTAQQTHAAAELAWSWGFTPDPSGPLASDGKER